MTPRIRPASTADIRQMAGIIGTGSTRALGEWMDDASAHAAWHVAEDEAGTLVGVQRVGLGEGLLPDVGEIATFLTDGRLRLAAGSQLFEATAEAARLLGYRWINAVVAETNEGARVYYQSHGFRLWGNRHRSQLLRFDLY